MNGTIYHPNQLVPSAVDSVTGFPAPLIVTGGVLQTSATLTGNITMNSSSWTTIGNGTSNVTQSPLSSQPVGASVGLVTISAIHGRLPSGGYNDIAVDSNGNMSINSTGLAQESGGNLSSIANNTSGMNVTLTAIQAQMTNGSQKATISNQLLNTTITPQLLVSGTASTASAAVSATAKFIVINPTVDSWVAISQTSTSPTAVVATAGSIFMAAGSQSYPFLVNASNTKVAAIANLANTTGYVTITEGQ